MPIIWFIVIQQVKINIFSCKPFYFNYSLTDFNPALTHVVVERR
ncbi:hypothetical protein SAMN06265379_101577 [Saccharicrinis carchari]|uniref:Uncharacterized protein n=1 Tax=Saccharicrinis carchari TaxID=1168039 RepID=A0A521B1A7_SACCC|nr:hypothetical protein SAMN06265379_101577 [Saccharicrinis carchari]